MQNSKITFWKGVDADVFWTPPPLDSPALGASLLTREDHCLVACLPLKTLGADVDYLFDSAFYNKQHLAQGFENESLLSRVCGTM